MALREFATRLGIDNKAMAVYSRPTILNVDDDEGCRYAVTRILEMHDFSVKEASSGADALRIAQIEQPDLVLLDVNLPDLNGFDVCRQLKMEPATARIPVVHITASYLTPSDMARGLESGSENYLVEPVEPEVLIATINSILRARRYAESARAMAREWQATFDAISDGVAVVDENGRIRRSNDCLARILGRPVTELIGAEVSGLWKRLAAKDEPFARAIQSRKREMVEFEYEGKRLHLVVDPMFDELGAPTGAVHIVSDITEKRRLEDQFRESQKFETIGTLAAGVAHDFNNLLTSIMGNASLIVTDLPEGSPHAEKLDDILRSSQRAADLTKQLLAYSGKGRHFLQKVELSTMVRRIQGLIEAAVPKKMSLELDLGKQLPRIDADANQVQQLILNLVSNAVEAIGEESGAIVLRTGRDAGDKVYIEVRDNGCGMDTETRGKIFDPFFTTKFTGRGLGLAAVAGIARGHNAEVRVTSAPGEGSTFRVSFPAAEELPPQPPRPQGHVGDTVLVVDDEDMVRRIAQASLEIRGYTVVVARNGLEAIREVRNNAAIGLVLLDLTMPVMGGEEAIDQILTERPGLKVIVSTGYDHREAIARFSNKPVAGYLQKPYTSRQLADKVKMVLNKK
jgi:PAS domain S-box-containing protein